LKFEVSFWNGNTVNKIWFNIKLTDNILDVKKNGLGVLGIKNDLKISVRSYGVRTFLLFNAGNIIFTGISIDNLPGIRRMRFPPDPNILGKA